MIGWGSQAPAQAQNIRDSLESAGLDIPVSNRVTCTLLFTQTAQQAVLTLLNAHTARRFHFAYTKRRFHFAHTRRRFQFPRFHTRHRHLLDGFKFLTIHTALSHGPEAVCLFRMKPVYFNLLCCLSHGTTRRFLRFYRSPPLSPPHGRPVKTLKVFMFFSTYLYKHRMYELRLGYSYCFAVRRGKESRTRKHRPGTRLRWGGGGGVERTQRWVCLMWRVSWRLSA